METQTSQNKSLHPLIWVAGFAVIMFSVLGTGAIMGWIPTSMGEESTASKLEATSADKSATKSAPSRAPTTAAQPRPVTTAAAPVRDAPARARIAARCDECGIIDSVREVTAKGSGSGIGAVGGAVVGGLLGNQVGGGRGQDVMTVVGAVGGAVAGNEVEKRVKATKSYVITVRLEDGTSREISQASMPAWRNGDKVKVVNGAIQSNG